MTNKEFIETQLNGMHIAFYKELILKCMDRYIHRSEDIIIRTEWAVNDAIEIMKVLGYTNTNITK